MNSFKNGVTSCPLTVAPIKKVCKDSRVTTITFFPFATPNMLGFG